MSEETTCIHEQELQAALLRMSKLRKAHDNQRNRAKNAECTLRASEKKRVELRATLKERDARIYELLEEKRVLQEALDQSRQALSHLLKVKGESDAEE